MHSKIEKTKEETKSESQKIRHIKRKLQTSNYQTK